ncbi:MAG TPA: 2Fe-2S iron-sulfur cluster-binding protein [Solirubrobacteraceae bacterium]|nr:2Fe-2S iron-sulfur cluster-binding protein [Solirubrobacteraceae bacterium]
MSVIEQPKGHDQEGATRRLKVYRYARDNGGERFDEFDVPEDGCKTVLDALRWIQLHRDPSLSLRHSCLHASCGTCGVRVDGKEALACVCYLADLGDEIVVEPMANVPAVTDVVVDMGSFYERLPDPHPIIRVSEVLPDAEPPGGLDAYVRFEDCIECALCVSACPIGDPVTGFVGPAALAAAGRLLEEPRGAEREEVLAWAAAPHGVWDCTTCMACVQACPAGIEQLPAIIGLRRALVERGDLDPLLANALQNFALQGNSYGKSSRTRARWTRALDFQIPDARTEPVDYVWFVGDFASFDERVTLASQRLARILHDAGVSFGLLFEGERSAGNDVRRVGEEGLFQALVEHNLDVLRQAEFKAIFTTDPHSLNTLRNDYPEFGLDKPVYHYTELLADLVTRGVLSLNAPLTGVRVTYHDPCYLARYNDITDQPRELIRATGCELIEMPRHGANTFCCGAGGGRIWMSESDGGERPSEQRIREAQALGGIDYFVVSCPKDLAMYTDAAKTVGAEFEVVELTALVERALQCGSNSPISR